MNTFDDSTSSPSTDTPQSQWPRVIGTIGIVVGVLMFLDEVDDLWMQLTWTESDWRWFFSSQVADLIATALRPSGWRLASIAIEMGLGVLLVVGSLRLKQRRRLGVSLCRTWAWLAIAWAVVDIARAASLLARYEGQVPSVPVVSWETAIVLGIGFAIVLMLTFPVFLLVWLGRASVRAECASWMY